MLVSSPMRFGTDIFGEQTETGKVTLTRSARLEALEPLDAQSASYVDGIKIEGTQPAGTTRRFLFKVDGRLYKFFNGTPQAYTGDGSLSNILKWGNTDAELAAVTEIPSWVGKQIYPIIALSAPYDSDYPTVRLSLKVRTVADVLSKTLSSHVTPLQGDSPTIVEITPDVVLTGQASATIKVQLYHSGQWSSWLNLPDALKQPATYLRFQILAKVVDLDTDSVQVNAIRVRYAQEQSTVKGSVTELFTNLVDFEVPLQTAYLVVRHKRLRDSSLQAYVAFRPAHKHRTQYSLGTANGAKQSFALPDAQIDHASLQVFVEALPVSDFDYNLNVNEVTLTAPAGAAVAVSYDYNCGVEQWVPMTRDGTQQPYSDGKSYASRFSYAGNDAGLTQAAVRLVLTRPTGKANNTWLTVAKGYTQSLVLPHAFDESTLSVNADWTYDTESHLLTFVAPKNTTIRYSGTWAGESHELYSFAAGFAL